MQTNNTVCIEPSLYRKVIKLMGNRFEISIVTDDELWANECIDAAVEEIRRIEKLLTTFNESSQANIVNRYAGIKPVKVDKEVFELVLRSKKISDLTQGAFDITYGSMDKDLWNFNKDMTRLPHPEIAQQLVRLINYNNVILNEHNSTIFLKEKGMRIGFGGIGKGYAADRAKIVLEQRGITSGIVNAAGDLSAWGFQPSGRPWTIGIADPNAARNAFSYLEITNTSIATSGNYEKFIVIDGKKYSHTIDPKTGLPVTGIKSVTIISPSAELADAMATPVMIMGTKVGLNMINQVKGLACIIIDDNDIIYTSKNIHLK
ncbi:FAD:protein FMN transferase [soil metagenome]